MNHLKFENFIDDNTCAVVQEWPEKSLDSGYLIQRGFGRYNNHVDKIPLKLSVIDEIESMIVSKISSTYKVEPVLRYFVSINTKGAAMDNHIDATTIGFKHLRFNIWVTQPDGGLPVLHPKSGDEIVNVRRGDMWCLFASDFLHETEPVTSETKRISLSFGFLVPEDFKLEDIK